MVFVSFLGAAPAVGEHVSEVVWVQFVLLELFVELGAVFLEGDGLFGFVVPGPDGQERFVGCVPVVPGLAGFGVVAVPSPCFLR